MRSLLTEVYLSIKKGLARSVAGLVPPKDIEDIVQEAYVRMCGVEQPEKIQNPKSYLYRTVRNLALDYVKRSDYRLVDSLEDDNVICPEAEMLIDNTFDKVVANEEFALFCEAIRCLPIQCRRVFILKKVYGYSQREIAQKLAISESTVEKHIAQGTKRCTLFMESSQQPQQGEEKVFSLKTR